MEKETGVVKWFNERKGFGFIVRDSGDGDIFVHHSAIEGEGFKTLNEGDRVEYVVTQGQKGPAAGDVKKLSVDLSFFPALPALRERFSYLPRACGCSCLLCWMRQALKHQPLLSGCLGESVGL